MKFQRAPSRKHSQGAVLIVALILLLAMTILGISAIDSSSLESKMSRNSLEAQTRYQVTLSEIQGQYQAAEDSNYREKIRNSNTIIPSTHIGVTSSGPGLALTDSSTDMTTYDATDIYDQSGYLVLNSEGKSPLHGYSLNRFSVMDYEINIITQLQNTKSKSDQTQGMAHAAPLGQD